MDPFRDLFDKLDKDKDGFVSVVELHNEMKKIGVLSMNKAQAIVTNYDQNEDGRLNYEEFLNYMLDREKKWKIDFRVMDKNNCGAIDQEDIINVFKELGVDVTKRHAKGIIQMYELYITRMDKDGSMTVDWEEFLQHIILNPAENIGELVSSWKHSLVFDVGESRTIPIDLTHDETDLLVQGKFVLAAGLADGVSRTVTAPIDRLKTHLQVYGSKAVSLRSLELKAGGFKSMWQGNTANVLKGTPQSTLQCFIYGQLRLYTLGNGDSLSVQQRFGLGCVSGAVAHAVFYPLEVLKVNLNLQQVGTSRGMWGCAKSIYQNESASAFYRGFKPSILCMIPYAGVECAVHQSIMSWAKKNSSENSESKLFFFSFVGFASGQLSSYPLAVVRTQQQAQAFRPASQASTGVLQGFIGIYEKHGMRGFYNGMGTSFVRAVPCALMNYTLTSKLEALL